MKWTQGFFDKNIAGQTASFMKVVCCVVIFLQVFMLTMCFLGRTQYDLTANGNRYEHAIYAEENHNFTSRALTVSTKDKIYVHTTAADEKIDLISYIAISLMFSINIVPLIFAYWFLAKVFSNVSKGEIFVEKNAHYLLYYGIIQAVVAVIVPFVKLGIVGAVNMLTTDRISIATGSSIINDFIPSIAFFVAAYIINYGVHLQDEVDHTL